MKKFTLAEIAKLTQAKLVGNPDHSISNIDSLETATPEDASFLANLRYRDLLSQTKAGVVCIDQSIPPIEGMNFLISDNPSRTFQKIAEIFLNESFHNSGFEGIHPSAIIHPSVKLGARVSIGPNAVIDQGCVIGDDTKIFSLVSIGPGVSIGSQCIIHPSVVIRERCQIGNRVILQPGAIIGSCGFGYTTDAKGMHTKLEQIGNVVLEDDVEIGANTTIDLNIVF